MTARPAHDSIGFTAPCPGKKRHGSHRTRAGSSPERASQADANARPLDGHGARRGRHDRLGRLHAPATPAGAAGPISLLGWIFTGAGAMLLALVFANLGRARPRTGGPYTVARRAFGDFAGFQTAWGYWIAVRAGNAAIAVAFVGYFAVFWPAARDAQSARCTARHRADLVLTLDQRPWRA